MLLGTLPLPRKGLTPIVGHFFLPQLEHSGNPKNKIILLETKFCIQTVLNKTLQSSIVIDICLLRYFAECAEPKQTLRIAGYLETSLETAGIEPKASRSRVISQPWKPYFIPFDL